MSYFMFRTRWCFGLFIRARVHSSIGGQAGISRRMGRSRSRSLPFLLNTIRVGRIGETMVGFSHHIRKLCRMKFLLVITDRASANLDASYFSAEFGHRGDFL